MGRRFTVGDLSRVLNVPASSLLDAVGELVRAELFAESDDALAFGHDLTREAVRASQPASAVQALDRQVAAAFLAAGALPLEVASQLAASAAPGDELAIRTLAKAAEALGPTDPGQAADLARRAIDLAGKRHALRGPLVARTALLLHAAARAEEAKAFADAELRRALPAEHEAEVRLGIGSMFSLGPDLRADSCRRALALPGLRAELNARLMAQLFHNLVVADRPEEAQALLGKVREAVEATGDGVARFTLELAEAGLEYVRGHFDAALVLVDVSLRTSVAAGDDSRHRLAVHLRCGVLAATDRFDQALADAAEGVSGAQEDRQGWALHLFETWRGRQLVQLGRLGDAAAILEGRYSPEDAHLVVGALDAASVVALGRIALHRGDRRQTEQTGAIARVMLETGAPGVRRHAAWLLALQAMAEGDPGRARDRLSAVIDQERPAVFPLFPIDPSDDPQLVRVALASGDVDLAEAVARGAEQRRDRNPDVPTMAASAAHARGLLAGDRCALADAVTLVETSGRTIALASAVEDLAVLDARSGETDAAVRGLGRALALYAACEASWDAARVRRRLRELGVRRRLVGARRPSSGWAALTESELAVVRLVADGLTNREVAERLYVSPHTVNGHLRHAFGKLRVNSRVSLTRVVAGHRDTGDALEGVPNRGGHNRVRGGAVAT
jgi:DNA-binding CsgD family transcriptional regulator